MNIENIIIEIRNILEGCHSIIDAHFFRIYYKNKYPEYEQIINSLIDGYSYFDKIDIITKQEIIREISNCDDRQEAYNIIERNSNRTNDKIFLNCLEKIANTKNYINKNNNINITKSCPHCDHKITLPSDTKYAICGYHNTNIGFDQKGCGKDFCFDCGKKLCKSWFENHLYNEHNKIHDDSCCVIKAIENDEDYSNYCQCQSQLKSKSNSITKTKCLDLDLDLNLDLDLDLELDLELDL
jgi:hypothetical protein